MGFFKTEVREVRALLLVFKRLLVKCVLLFLDEPFSSGPPLLSMDCCCAVFSGGGRPKTVDS